MQYTVNKLFNDLKRNIHKGSLNQTSDIFGAAEEGVRAMLARIYPPELERSAFIEQALYNHVNRYIVPEDMNGDMVISMKSLPGRHVVGNWLNPLTQIPSEYFGQGVSQDQYGFGGRYYGGNGGNDWGNMFRSNSIAIQNENGIKFILLPDMNSGDARLINKIESLTENGSWNTYGNIVNLRNDPLRYIGGNGSLAFDFNSSGTTGALENYTMQSVDLYDFVGVGANFLWFDITDWQQVISAKLIWASSLTDWYEYTVTAPHDNNQFVDGWNLLRFPFQNMTTIGTPNPRAINRIRIEFQTTGMPQINCHVNSLISRKGRVYLVNYYSAYCFRDSQTNAWKQSPTSGNDIINLEQDAYEILLKETADALTQENTGNFKSGGVTTADHIQFRQKLDYTPSRPGQPGGLYFEYNKKYKSKIANPSQESYHFMDGRL